MKPSKRAMSTQLATSVYDRCFARLPPEVWITNTVGKHQGQRHWKLIVLQVASSAFVDEPAS